MTKKLVAIGNETGITEYRSCEDCQRLATVELFGLWFCEGCAPPSYTATLGDWFDDKYFKDMQQTQDDMIGRI